MIFLLVREHPLVSYYVFPRPPGKDLWLTIATGFSKPTLWSPKFEMKHFARLKALYSREMLDEKITRFPKKSRRYIFMQIREDWDVFMSKDNAWKIHSDLWRMRKAAYFSVSFPALGL